MAYCLFVNAENIGWFPLICINALINALLGFCVAKAYDWAAQWHFYLLSGLVKNVEFIKM